MVRAGAQVTTHNPVFGQPPVPAGSELDRCRALLGEVMHDGDWRAMFDRLKSGECRPADVLLLAYAFGKPPAAVGVLKQIAPGQLVFAGFENGWPTDGTPIPPEEHGPPRLLPEGTAREAIIDGACEIAPVARSAPVAVEVLKTVETTPAKPARAARRRRPAPAATAAQPRLL